MARITDIGPAVTIAVVAGILADWLRRELLPPPFGNAGNGGAMTRGGRLAVDPVQASTGAVAEVGEPAPASIWQSL